MDGTLNVGERFGNDEPDMVIFVIGARIPERDGAEVDAWLREHAGRFEGSKVAIELRRCGGRWAARVDGDLVGFADVATASTPSGALKGLSCGTATEGGAR